MALETGEANQVVALERWEFCLAENTASDLAQILPENLAKGVLRELLGCLRKEKERRLLLNLNHWEQYAPAFLAQELKRRIDAERLRQEEAAAFIAKHHGEALTFARTFFSNPEDAEDAVAEADIKLWEGKTFPKVYFRKLRQIIINKLKRRKKEGELFEVTESFDGPKIRRTEDLWECVSTFHDRPDGEDDGTVGLDDPLLDLLHREAVEEGIRGVVSDRKRHSVMQRQWWKDLVAHRPRAAKLLRK